MVEQICVYQELDGLDLDAYHLVGWHEDKVAAYLRLIAPNLKFDEPSIGRVLTTQAYRKSGLGRQMMAIALGHAEQLYPQQNIRISAQVYLDAFYRSFGFVPCSEPYLEDGIPHVEMLRSRLGSAST